MERFNLKPMSKDAVPSALAKAERYRLLNEPGEAESICLDVLQIDPQNEEALVMLLLAVTDQFPHDSSARTVSRANELAARLGNDYDRAYYSGIIRERRAKAVLQRDAFAAGTAASGWLREAMTFFERAQTIRPAHNDDAVLRWNACGRLLQQLPDTEPADIKEHPIQSE